MARGGTPPAGTASLRRPSGAGRVDRVPRFRETGLGTHRTDLFKGQDEKTEEKK